VYPELNLLAARARSKNVICALLYGAAALTSSERNARGPAAMLRASGLADRARTCLISSPAANSHVSRWPGRSQSCTVLRPRADGNSIRAPPPPSHEIMENHPSSIVSKGSRFIVVTHEPDSPPYADRCDTMRDGRILSRRASGRRQHAEQRDTAPNARRVVAVAIPAAADITGVPTIAWRPTGLPSMIFRLYAGLTRNKLRSA